MQNVSTYRKLTSEQIIDSLHINGHEDLLLERFSKGDKAALLQLVMMQMPYIINIAHRRKDEGVILSDLIDYITNFFIKYLEAQAEQLLTGKLNQKWNESFFPIYNKAVYSYPSTPKLEIKRIELNKPVRTAHLNYLNNTLISIENEVKKRITLILESSHQKRVNKDSFVTDYMIDLKVSYYLKKSKGNPQFTNDFDFSYRSFIVDKNHEILNYYNEHNSEYDYIQRVWENWPILENHYCFLFYQFIEYSRISDKIFDIEMIWTDIKFTEQNCIRFKKDGKPIKVRPYKE